MSSRIFSRISGVSIRFFGFLLALVSRAGVFLAAFLAGAFLAAFLAGAFLAAFLAAAFLAGAFLAEAFSLPS